MSAAEPGEASPLTTALLAAGREPGRAARAEVLAALVHGTVYAAVSATATGEHRDAGTGLRAESGAELAVLLLEAGDGTRALPVFSDLDQLRHWRVDVRPQQLTGAQACQAARGEGADQVVLDPAGTALVLAPDEVAALAGGWVPVPGSTLSVQTAELAPAGTADAGTELVAALRAALRGEDLRAARLLLTADGLVLGVAPRRALEPAALAALAQRIVDRLGPALPAEGLALTQVDVRGPGQPILRRRLFPR